MSSVEKARAQKSALIQDLKEVSKKYEGQQVTRDLYREQGVYSERLWHKHFSRFKDFVSAAGIETVDQQSNQPEVNEYKGDVWNVTLPKTDIHTLDQLLDYCQVDRQVWAVEHWLCNKWSMGSKDADGNIVTTPLYQVKASLRRRPEVIAMRDEIERLKADAKLFSRLPDPVIHSSRKSGNLLELSLCDLHLGKLAWGRETDGPDYDTAIAEQTFLKAVEALLDRAAGYSYDRILLVLGNDMLNSDDMQGRTTKGTFVNTDTRYQKIFSTARKMLTSTIERLRKVAPVDVVMVSGNHDALSTWTLGESLECYFHNYTDVTVQNEPTYFKYYRWGQTLLMLTHGDKGRRSDFPLLLATERSKDFGETRFHEIHTGHLHSTKVEEFHGVRVRILPSLSPADSWHAQHGFKGQQREAVSFVFNDEQGMLAQFFYNADNEAA